jgi:hypothetical protein
LWSWRQECIQPLGDQPPPLRKKVAVALGGEQGRISGDALAGEGLVAVFGDQLWDVGGGGLVADAAVGAAADEGEVGDVVDLACPVSTT